MKRLTFTPASADAELLLSVPHSANRERPPWYRKMPLFLRGAATYGVVAGGNGMIPNTTLRACVPFKEALTAGYLITLQADLQVVRRDAGFDFLWSSENTLVSAHSPEQSPGLPSAVAGKPGVMKWFNEFVTTTPTGYSSLFTHPMNRHDLPFRTFSGVVETDRYPLPVQFPFEMLDFDGDSTIIPKGTPVAQMLPFKRDDFIASVGRFDEAEVRRAGFDLHSVIVSSYRRQWWVRKTYGDVGSE